MKILAIALTSAAALTLSGCMTSSMAMSPTAEVAYVGGAAMYPSMNIVQNAINSPIHTTLVAAVKQANLVDTLSGAGPFTVFAPTNDAFAKLPAAAVNSLMMDSNRAQLATVLTYHVVPGRLTAADLMAMIAAGGGRATLTTVQGQPLYASMMGQTIMLTDAKGGMSHVTQGNVMQSNGVIHVVDSVLMP